MHFRNYSHNCFKNGGNHSYLDYVRLLFDAIREVVGLMLRTSRGTVRQFYEDWTNCINMYVQ